MDKSDKKKYLARKKMLASILIATSLTVLGVVVAVIVIAIATN